ncbi:hypothetical protein FOXYSP1_19434 [Fusarium oxysporum f. sp. phaseoli]
MKTDELTDWGDLLAWNKIHIECSLPGRKVDSRFSHRREDCECAEDIAALLKLQSYELLVEEPDGSWRGLAPWIAEMCQCSSGPCKKDTCGYSECECRGLPCLEFLVKKDSITPTFIDELLNNPKLYAIVWNGLDGTLYKPCKFDPKHVASWMSRRLESKSGDWVPRAGPTLEGKLSLEEYNLQHLEYEVYICQVAMGMEWKDYSGMNDEEFCKAITKFNIVDEVVSVLESAGVKPSE